MDLKPVLYGLDEEEIKQLMKACRAPAYRAGQLLDWLYKKHIAALPEAKNLPAPLRDQLAAQSRLNSLELSESRASETGESVKFLFQTPDKHWLESVLILQKDRRTVCVSTQLGCKMGCVFCASGKGKFLRSLTAGEIVEQAVWIERKTAGKITNVVFMGMGEPLDNFEPVMKALKIFQAAWGFGLGARRITVSTVGITPKIEEFVKRSEGRVRLSVSLHAADQQMRSRLVPIAKHYPLAGLESMLERIYRRLKREITFEYTLIAGINDSDEDAAGVARLARPLDAKVNLIPCNPVRGENFKRPSDEDVEKFRGILEKHGVRVTVRQTAGREIDAACGQLRLQREAESPSENSSEHSSS